MGMSEGAVGPVDELFEVGRGDLGGGDEEGEDSVGEVGEGEPSPVGFPVGRKGGDLGGDVEPALWESEGFVIKARRGKKRRRRERTSGARPVRTA